MNQVPSQMIKLQLQCRLQPPSKRHLVAAVKDILPLGSQDWAILLTQYNKYAHANNKLNPLKIEFQALVNHSKPTGDPLYMYEAKATQMAMDKRAEILECSDLGLEEEDNGVGAKVNDESLSWFEGPLVAITLCDSL
ncbi:hypothetical protein VP01_941g22 [Puccinia sorghi]|uniref:Uncharacterized protein n=1 Tax=Puccinia sorghi TaxID=27349 RepID=A0A0L6U765_9BASI|nr:hypothetical protein VP01_941g22 [Puccinia sorghi]